MLTKLNLASHPFRNRTLPWAITMLVATASLVALVLLVAETRQMNAQAERIEVDVAALRKQRASLQEKAAEVRESLPPDQLKTLEAAHTLVDRKLFSWSKLLADLEQSLPQNVRVSRITVRDTSRVGGQTRADLDLAVVGRTPSDVTQMISEMNRTGIFSAVPVSENPKTGRGEIGYEWTLRVSYVQRATAPAGRSDTEATNVAARDVAEQSRANSTQQTSTREAARE